MTNKIDEMSEEILDDWEKKVFDEYLKRNKETGEAYKLAQGQSSVGILSNIVSLFFIALLYVLYKLHLPFEMILWVLISLYASIVMYKHMLAGEFNILGKAEHPVELPSSRLEWEFASPSFVTMTPTHDVFIKFIKHLKNTAYILAFIVILISALIYLFMGTLLGSELLLFILGLVVIVSQSVHLGIRALNSLDERNEKLHNEVMELADEMEEEGLITREEGWNK